MMSKTLSCQPLIDPSADVRDCTLARYTEVGARTRLLKVELSDYSHIVNDSDAAYASIGKFCSIEALADFRTLSAEAFIDRYEETRGDPVRVAMAGA